MGVFSILRELFGLGSRSVPDSGQPAEAAPGATAVAPPPREPIRPEPGPAAWWVPRDEPVLAPPETDLPERGIDRNLYSQCVAALDNPNLKLPQLSHVAQQLLVMLRSDDVDLHRAADLATRDAALTADVLRLVNSTAYRGVVEIRGLDQAFARLGRRPVRSLVLASTVKGVTIRTGGAQRSLGEELWRRSLASAVVVSSLGQRYKLPEDEAFLVGLLHDIGMLAVLKLVHEFQRSSKQKVPRAVYDALCQQWHQHLGLRLADAWSLPDPLPEVIGNHHRAPADDDPLKTYRLLVGLADAVCALLEYAPYVPYDFFNLPCVQRLGLEDDAETQEWLATWPDLIAERMEFF